MKEVAEAAAAPPFPSSATAAAGARPTDRRLFMLNRLVDTILHAPERCGAGRSRLAAFVNPQLPITPPAGTRLQPNARPPHSHLPYQPPAPDSIPMTWTLVEPHLSEACSSPSPAVRAEALDCLGRAVSVALRLPREHLESARARRAAEVCGERSFGGVLVRPFERLFHSAADGEGRGRVLKVLLQARASPRSTLAA